MIEFWKFSLSKIRIFSTISIALIILIIVFADSLISNPQTLGGSRKTKQRLGSGAAYEPLLSVREDNVVGAAKSDDRGCFVSPSNITVKQRLELFRKKLPEIDILKPNNLTRIFDSRVRSFLGSQCKINFFMTWISPTSSFGNRVFLAIESLFRAHPQGCLIILSNTMDSEQGRTILKPLTDLGYRVRALAPDLSFLFSNTPAEAWFNDLKSGNKDPGRVPLAQNLSNLIRLAILYKYGGVYLDTDVIVLKDFSGLRNTIGAQGVDGHGNWTRLNNAVLIFDKQHPLVYKFIEDFAFHFNGNQWGHNGPYLVSRVIERENMTQDYTFTIVPPLAFYPVDWIRIPGLFLRPNDTVSSRWVEAKLLQLNRVSYGVHLWNKQTSKLVIEEGSVIGRLISDHCVICKDIF